MIKVKSIGTGGGFDYKSSSFLIEDDGVTILFDAGYGVFEYLKENNKLEDITYIFISHTHFDHIGNLEQIIFYRYFVLGRTTTIISGKDVLIKLKNIFEDINTVYENGTIKEQNIAFFNNLNAYDSKYSAVKGNHIVTPSYGFAIKDKLLISGDTKASIDIMDWMRFNTHSIVLHDYSDWNEPLDNIHFTEYEYEKKYKSIIENSKINFIKYHNSCDEISFTITKKGFLNGK